MLIRRVLMFAMTAALAGCTLSNKAAPALTGPSELALSLAISASPDHISQDGSSQSVVTVLARDAAGQPMRGLSLHADLFVNGIQADFGTLSSRTLSTANDGRATIAYLAPPPPPATASDDNVVTIYMTPVGTDFGATIARSVQIRLMRPGAILPPNGTPVANFFFSPTQPKEHDAVQFDASASKDDGQIVSYAWAFGDGTTGTGVRPTHTYHVSGTYQVILTVTDDRGLSASTAPTPVPVTAGQSPTAAFTASPINPSVGQSVTFNGSASSAPSGHNIVAYAWDFGDGQRSSGVTAAHTYTVAATYTVVLSVTDDVGRVAVASQTVQVGGSNPTASFTVSPTNPSGGQSVTFNAAASSAPPGRTIVSYAWDFGDGRQDTGLLVAHTYTVASTYTVVLTVTDDLGRVGVSSQTLQVGGANPTAAFTTSPTTPSVGQSVTFNASASTASAGHSIVSYKWDFGDGNQATGATVTHTYTTASAYTVVLTVADDLGRVGVASQTLQVGAANPTAAFTFSPTNPLVNQGVQFNASASIAAPGRTIASYAWDFGDGSPQACCVTATHVFAVNSTFTVVLTVTDDLGRVGVTSQTVTVGGPTPTASFTFSKIDPIVGETIQMNGSASTAPAGRTITTYDWDFGDGQPHASGVATAHAYGSAGTYTVVLRVIDSQSVLGVTSRTITVK